MAASSLRCGSFATRPNGWIFPLKHSDVATDLFDSNADVVLGGRACPGSNLGHVVKVRLRDGWVTSLTDQTNEPSYGHGSARNIDRPGWFHVTYSRDPSYAGDRFHDEVIAVKLDGSGAVERFAHTPSSGSVHDYVVDARDARALAGRATPVLGDASLSLRAAQAVGHGLKVVFTLPSPRVAALTVFDIAGRRRSAVAVGSLGAGTHTLDLDEPHVLESGVYFVMLSDGRAIARARAIVVR